MVLRSGVLVLAVVWSICLFKIDQPLAAGIPLRGVVTFPFSGTLRRHQMNRQTMNLLLRGGSTDSTQAIPNPNKVHKVRKMALKAAKSSGDEAAIARVREGELALSAGNLTLALAIFEKEAGEGTRVARNSTKAKIDDRKSAKPSPVSTSEASKHQRMRLLLAPPSHNLQAKPIRLSMDPSMNFARNTNETLRQFLTTFGTEYRTRFPPEPNGFLHIGHAKAMAFNFGQARLAREQGVGGETILRFDDTNPEAEDQQYIDAILRDVEWLGHKPVRVAYTSDYFSEMYNLALQLIDQGQAYVCHCSREEVRRQRALAREARLSSSAPPAEAESPFRDTPAAENRRKFEAMRSGEYRDGEASLRMKGDLGSDNPAMWDPVFYRVKRQPHPRTGAAWCIYPSYDFSHCIADSLEGITHSCCTLEFASRQAPDGPYYWLLHALGMYKPVTWEYSRCSIVDNVLSKRKLQALVSGGHVEGWDDPRLLTIAGLRRRGFSPATINRFCEQIGVSTSLSTATHLHVLEAVAREELDGTAPRVFAVLRPLRVEIRNAEALRTLGELEGDDAPEAGIAGFVRVRLHPKNESMGSRLVPIGPELYIQRSDWRAAAEQGFHGLAPGGSVGLVGTNLVLHCEEEAEGGGGEGAPALRCVVRARKESPRPKGNIQWVVRQRATRIAVRTFGPLLLPEADAKPPHTAHAAAAQEAAEGGVEEEEGGGGDGSWLRTLNPASMVEEEDAVVEAAAVGMEGPVQFMREGFFVRDAAQKGEAPARFLQVVALKSSYTPKGAG